MNDHQNMYAHNYKSTDISADKSFISVIHYIHQLNTNTQLYIPLHYFADEMTCWKFNYDIAVIWCSIIILWFIGKLCLLSSQNFCFFRYDVHHMWTRKLVCTEMDALQVDRNLTEIGFEINVFLSDICNQFAQVKTYSVLHKIIPALLPTFRRTSTTFVHMLVTVGYRIPV